MKKITSALILVSQLFFGSSLLANTDGMAVIDYQAIFFGTDAARQAFEELQESDEYKEITDDIALKDGERKDAADKLEKDGPQCQNLKKLIFIKNSIVNSRFAVFSSKERSTGAGIRSKITSRTSRNSSKSR